MARVDLAIGQTGTQLVSKLASTDDDLYGHLASGAAHTPAQVGLSNVPNVDTTEAGNISSGRLRPERVPMRREYIFNGSDAYVTIPSYSTLGDPSIYRTISYDSDGPDDYVIDDSAEPITEFGRVGANYHQGNLRNVSIIDASPIQGSSVVFGNGSRYATLDSVISLTGDFTIEFDYIRQDSVVGTAFQTLLSSNSTSHNTFFIYDSGHASFPDVVTLTGSSGTNSFSNTAIFSSVAAGQHCKVKIERVGATTNFYLDGVLAETNTVSIGTVSIDTLLINFNRSTRAFAAGCAIQGLQVSDGTNTYLYPLQEATGTQIVNDGNTGIPYYGDWTAATWTYVDENSRFYALGEEDGDTLADRVDGQDGTIQNYVRNRWRRRGSMKTKIWSKPAGEPYFLVMTGQSRALGSRSYDPFPQNANVWDWATNGGSTPQLVENATWTLPVMDSGAVKADLDAAQPYVGYSNARRGNMAISCANRIQQVTGRDVYIVQVAKAGQNIAGWASPSGSMYTALNDAVAAALATPELAGLSGPDDVIWVQGESDVGNTPAAYSTAWRDLRDDVEGLWAEPGYVEYYLCELSQEYNRIGSTAFGAPKEWDGLEQVIADSDRLVHFVSSLGLHSRPGNEIHTTGNSDNFQGERIADLILFGDA